MYKGCALVCHDVPWGAIGCGRCAIVCSGGGGAVTTDLLRRALRRCPRPALLLGMRRRTEGVPH